MGSCQSHDDGRRSASSKLADLAAPIVETLFAFLPARDNRRLAAVNSRFSHVSHSIRATPVDRGIAVHWGCLPQHEWAIPLHYVTVPSVLVAINLPGIRRLWLHTPAGRLIAEPFSRLEQLHLVTKIDHHWITWIRGLSQLRSLVLVDVMAPETTPNEHHQTANQHNGHSWMGRYCAPTSRLYRAGHKLGRSSRF
jgi:hypothetical protein